MQEQPTRPDQLADPKERRNRFMIAIVTAVALVATTAGLSVASLGGTAQVSEAPPADEQPLPGDDDADEDEGTEVEDEDEAGEEPDVPLPEPASEGRANAQQHRDNAASFVAAVHDWTSCAAHHAQQHGEDPDFDPHTYCGPNPDPNDFGMPEDGRDDEDERETDDGPPAGVTPGGPPDLPQIPADAGPPSGAGP